MQMNRVVIAGYVSKKPEVRHLPSGTPVANVRVGETIRYAEGGGETRELTNWHSLSFYAKLAHVAQALKKGDNVYVDGRIEQPQVHRARRQQAADGARDRSEPVPLDRTSPTWDQRGGHGRRKKRWQRITARRRRGGK